MMKKIYNEHFDETYFTHTLDNGLELVIFYKPEFTTSAFAFGTNFGALKLKQIINGKEINYHAGAAHFLEHKLFEGDTHDIMLEFNALGANVNAYTSYDSTVYYFTITDKNIEAPLNLLLDFVQDLNISEESVEKEKGIIVQELKMYMEMSNVRLLFETYKAMYKTHPLKHDIGGSIDDVMKITKQELEECYRYNYHPTNMKLVMATGYDPEKLVEIVEKNQSRKTFDPPFNPVNIIEESQKNVVKKEVIEHLDVLQNKLAYGIKLESNCTDLKSCVKQEWALQILFETHFSSINPEYQNWIDENKISDFFGFEVDSGINYMHAIFYNEHEDMNEFKKFIENELLKLKTNDIDASLIEQIQKRFYGLAFGAFNETENIVSNHLKHLLNGLEYFDVVDIIMEIDKDYIVELYKNLDISNNTIVKICNN